MSTWYEEWFDRDEYEIVYQHRNEAEARQLIALLERVAGPAPGASILDVGCGRGRHALALASRGYDVTGIDISEASLSRARQRAADAGLRVRFETGDMREPYCTGCMDGVVNLFTAFGFFVDEADHGRTVQAMATALRPGGWLMQDFLNAPFVRDTFVPEDERVAEGLRITQRRWVADGRINKEITLRQNGAAHVFNESVRLLDRADLERLYAAAGLTVRAAFGHYDGRPHTPEAPRLILYTTKDDA